jgi:hypothetical protein
MSLIRYPIPDFVNGEVENTTENWSTSDAGFNHYLQYGFTLSCSKQSADLFRYSTYWPNILVKVPIRPLSNGEQDMANHQVQAADSRTLCFADYGDPSSVEVLCCHGGPGSRMEAKRSAELASAAGFRLIGIDWPGYGAASRRPDAAWG